jgi:NTE family protein
MCRLFIERRGRGAHAPAGAAFKPELLLSPGGRRTAQAPGAGPAAPARPSAAGTTRATWPGKRRGLLDSFERLKRSAAGRDPVRQAAWSASTLKHDLPRMPAAATTSASWAASWSSSPPTSIPGKRCVFGEAGWDDVPISGGAGQQRGARPVRAGRDQGPPFCRRRAAQDHARLARAGRRRRHAVLRECDRAVRCARAAINGPGKLSSGGLLDVLSQTMRSVLHSRVEIGMAGYRAQPSGRGHPAVRAEPARTPTCSSRISSSYANRRRMCEQAYQNTRADAAGRRAEIGPKLARHGLRLKLAVLRDTAHAGARGTAAPGPWRRTGRQSWTTLDRYVKVANG